ncbi:AAA family ATPase [Patescibacteria group bacterium]|nr:AAA family ATPase [Patescibacteria group bacterium]
MVKPKLIILYGFAASGKTTLAKMYIADNPLALNIEGDQIISMIGNWRSSETEARAIVLEYTQKLAEEHLKKGFDVIIPYLLTNTEDAELLREIAKHTDANFFEIYITLDRNEAIDRLLKRGVWGEEGSEQLTEADLPEIEELYAKMESSMGSLTAVKFLSVIQNDIDGTYDKFLKLMY